MKAGQKHDNKAEKYIKWGEESRTTKVIKEGYISEIEMGYIRTNKLEEPVKRAIRAQEWTRKGLVHKWKIN